MDILYTVKNICKILIWIALIPLSLSLFGLINGIIIYTLFSVVWSLSLTAIRAYFNNEVHGIKEIFKSTISGKYLLPITVYGYYCSPKYGVDGSTSGMEPIDGLDHACKIHDDRMLYTESQYNSSLISIVDYRNSKNFGDIELIKSAMTSNNTASGIYLLGIIVVFGSRVIFRKLVL